MQAAHLSRFSSIRYLTAFGSDPVGTMKNLRRAHGDFVVLRLQRRKIFFCFHPDLAQEILQKNQSSFRKSRAVFDQIIPLTGKRGLVQLEGKDGLTHRKLTVKAFSTLSLANYLPRFADNFSEFRAAIHKQMEEKREIDLAPHLARLVLSNALSMVVGTFDPDTIDPLLKDFLEINHLCGAEIRRKSSLSFFVRRSHTRRIKNVETRLSQGILHLIESGRQSQQESLIRQLFLENTDIQQIEHHVRTFLFAGFETTTTSILMTLYLLARNPSVKTLLQKQLQDGRLEDLPMLMSQRLLLNSYKESLRLYPPSWTLAREAIQNTSIGGEPVNLGDQVFFGLNEIHTHEHFWQRPFEFLPDRFNENKQHAFAFLPFGGGPRICIGMQAAYAESCYVIGSFLTHFDMYVSEDFSPNMGAQITSHPTNGLPAYVKKVQTYVPRP